MSEIERSVTIALGHNELAVLHDDQIYLPATEFPIRETVLDDEGNVLAYQWGFRRRTFEGG
jgi:hypothetical protein